MTYPSQPGQPYGQQPPGWQGQQVPGGYPQQGQFPPGGGQYPPTSQYGQPPMGGGYGPQPPKKKTGLWVGLSAAAVVIIAFVITGFVAPGFLLGDDEEPGNQNASGNTGQNVPGQSVPGPANPDDGGDTESASEAETLIDEIVHGFLDNDVEALESVVCDGAESGLRGFIDEAMYVEEIERTSPVEESGDTATATAHVYVTDGEEEIDTDMTITVADEDGGWCWKDLEQD